MKLNIPDYFYNKELEAERYIHYFREDSESLSESYHIDRYKPNERCKTYLSRDKTYIRNKPLSGEDIDHIISLFSKGMTRIGIATAYKIGVKRVNRLIEQIKTQL